MTLPFAESLSIEDINDLCGSRFSTTDIKRAGSVKVVLGLRGITKLNNVPKHKGIYAIAVSIDGGPLFWVYVGKSADKCDGINHRVHCHFNVKQNEESKSGPKMSGPLKVYNKLTDLYGYLSDRLQWYVAVWGYDGPDGDYAKREVDAMEKRVLHKINFIGNDDNNGGYRLEALDTIFRPAPALAPLLCPTIAPAPECAAASPHLDALAVSRGAVAKKKDTFFLAKAELAAERMKHATLLEDCIAKRQADIDAQMAHVRMLEEDKERMVKELTEVRARIPTPRA